MSTKAFQRVVWIVFDGLGHEHVRRCMSTDYPALTRLSSEGHLGPSRPSSPACETPTALYTLFTGIEPSESGIWGYRMPDPKNSSTSMSGFDVRPLQGQTIWDVLEGRGERYSLMNVAFRNDPVWRDGIRGLDIGCDGYRLSKKPMIVQLCKDRQDVRFGGIDLTIKHTPGGVRIRKGGGCRAFLTAGEGRILELTRGLRAYAFLLDDRHLAFSHIIQPMMRGGSPSRSLHGGIIDLNVFGTTRKVNERSQERELVSIDSEMTPSLLSARQKQAQILEAIRETQSRLVIGYVPVVDEFNHVYMDRLETEWPAGRVSALLKACMSIVDETLAKVMAAVDSDTLLVVSSDHGAVPYRRRLHLNELLVSAGLVRRSAEGYDLRRSIAYYHPSECGLVVMQPFASRAEVMRRLGRSLDEARASWGTHIGLVELHGPEAYPAFLYPMSDSALTGSPPRPGAGALDLTKAGGHHRSPLTPTPWIQAVLGLWSPRSQTLGRDLAGIPNENRQLKDFLLDLIH